MHIINIVSAIRSETGAGVLQCWLVACLQAWSAQQLQQDLGFTADQAKQLAEWSHGLDSGQVAERPPPKTLSIQMTLTPIPLVMHPSMGRDIAVAGGKAGKSATQFFKHQHNQC